MKAQEIAVKIINTAFGGEDDSRTGEEMELVHLATVTAYVEEFLPLVGETNITEAIGAYSQTAKGRLLRTAIGAA